MTAVELAGKLLNADKEKVFIVAQIAPAVRVTIGEKFGMGRGEDGMKKLSFALRALGADAVVDTAIAQDVVTLMQWKALQLKKEKGGAPVVAGKGGQNACPGEISARLLKKYYREKEAGKSVRVVAVACCEKAKNKIKGADVILTADELAEMIIEAGINLRLLDNVAIDMPFGVACGSAYICAAAGGKAEAVARCLMEDKSRVAVQKLAYSGLYGKGAVREATIAATGREWKFAVVICPEAAEKVRADIENGVCEYDFVEFSCGGCIAKGLEKDEDKEMTLKLRGLGLRYLDKAHAARSADMSSYSALALKEWESMVRSGEAFAENAPITEEELQPAPVEEIVEETLVEEIPVEEVAEEVVEEPAIEETPIEETLDDVAMVEETVAAFVEETAEEVAEIIAEDIVDETVEEAVEQISVEELAEEVLERYGEDATEEEVREVVEELVEEVLEDAVEEYVEEVVDEFVDEHMEDVIEDAVEDIAAEMIDDIVENVDEKVAEMVEEAVTDALADDAEDEIVEEATEEVVEEIVEAVVEELVQKTMKELEEEAPVEEVVEETPVEETEEEPDFENMSEEERMKRDPYYRRLSGRERRKLKRKNKNSK